MRVLLIPMLALPLLATAPAAAQEKSGVERAATAPLRDTRIKDDKIPEILQLAASAPYSLKGTSTCAGISAEVRKLDTALGTDVDVPAKKKGEGSAIAAAAAGEAVKSIIPGLGLVRVVTGADKQQRRVEAAVYARAVRRGYLKGIGLSRHCPLPAAPTRQAQLDTPEIVAPEAD